MRVTVLGSGQDGGLPQVGTDHPNDVKARRGEIPRRTASSLLVEKDGFRLLLDAGPDLRLQLERERIDTVDAVALTHGHMGHYAGLVHFGKEAAAANIPLVITPSMLAFVSANQPWAATLDYLRPLVIDPGGSTTVGPFTVGLYPVVHRAEFTDNVAISVDDTLLYLPDLDAWEQWPEAETVVGGHDLCFLDASFWADGEIPGVDMSQIPHPFIPETMERFAAYVDRVVLTHLNHTNPACDPESTEHKAVRERGFRVAADGDQFTL